MPLDPRAKRFLDRLAALNPVALREQAFPQGGQLGLGQRFDVVGFGHGRRALLAPVGGRSIVGMDEVEGRLVRDPVPEGMLPHLPDGGAISYKSFDEGVVTVELRGSCSGCPSSTVTLKAGIENLLKRMVPEVTEVVSEAM